MAAAAGRVTTWLPPTAPGAVGDVVTTTSGPLEGHPQDVKRIFAYLAKHDDPTGMIDPNDQVLSKTQPTTQTAELHQTFPYAADPYMNRFNFKKLNLAFAMHKQILKN